MFWKNITYCHVHVAMVGALMVAAYVPLQAYAASCASPGVDGSASSGGVVNTYWTGTSNPIAGSTSFTLGAATGASNPIAPGDLLLLIQMQDANINSNNTGNYGDGAAGDPASGYTNIRRAGRYEYVRATNAVPTGGGTLTISSGVIYNYENSNATTTRGQRRFQIVRVPQYVDFTVAATLTSAPWDGQQGGIVALDVANILDLNSGTIDVSELGFRGGGARSSTTGSGSFTDYRTPFSNGANGAKGESISGTPQLIWDSISVVNTGTDGYPNGSFGRGSPGNGGGGGTDGRPTANDRNTGGGGGAGYGDGGKGGHAWCPGGPSVCEQSGGFGGKGVTVQTVNRLTLGGGGGAGTTNNATGVPGGGVASSGEAGGGIILIRAKTITGSGTLRANGADGNTTVDNDGSGGGGGGGTLLIDAEDTTSASITAQAMGGDGGSNGNSSPHGPGGGGGGGLVLYTSSVTGLSTDVSGGVPGTTEGNPAPFNLNYGATAGGGGSTSVANPVNIPGFSSGDECVVEVVKDFTPELSAANQDVRLTLTLTNPNPSLPMSSLNVTDSYPANVQNGPVPDIVSSCGGTVTAAAGTNSIALSGATLAANASCTIEVDVRGTTGGTYENIIPIGDATAQIGGISVENINPTSDTLTVTQPLTAVKTVTVISDDIHGTSSPYALPGAVVEYTISFSNPSASPIDVDTVVITDVIPAETSFLNAPLAGGLAVAFDDGAPPSGLSLTASDISFSNDNGATFSYGPSAGVDSAVTHLRVSPSGIMAANSSAAIRFRMVLE